MQVTMVMAVPLDSPEAFCATKVENMGESAITTNPQNRRNVIRMITEFILKTIGKTRQHIQESNKAINARFLAPIVWDNLPLKRQPKLPVPMMIKDHMGMLRLTPEWISV